MKGKNDVGLTYVKKLGINPERSARSLFGTLTKKYGRTEADDYMASLYDCGDKDQDLFYKLKNADYDKSMIFSGGYDADIIRRACNWINNHKELFGNSILEIGCDCGFMTSFIALTFPKSHVVAIDRNEDSIKIAQKNVEKFGLSNVEFITCEASDLQGRVFDTVFSMRTAQENRKKVYIEHYHDDWRMASEEFIPVINDYVVLLDSLTSKNGTLVSIERMDVDPLFLAWLKALNKSNFRTDINEIEQLHVKELEDEHDFPIIVAKRGEPIPNKALEEKWIDMLEYLPEKKRWYGWEAIAAVNDKAEALIDGSYVINDDEEKVGKMAYFSVKGDPNSLLYLVNAGEQNCILMVVPKGQESAIKENLFMQLDNNRRVGLKIKHI